MAYLALTDPFPISFDKDGIHYEGLVTYAKKDDCSAYFFDVIIREPKDIEPIRLQERPTLNPDYDYMVWVDENSRVNAIYQEVGTQIEAELKKLGVFLIDAAQANHQGENARD